MNFECRLCGLWIFNWKCPVLVHNFGYCFNFKELFAWWKFMNILLYTLYDTCLFYVNLYEFWMCTLWFTDVLLNFSRLVYIFGCCFNFCEGLASGKIMKILWLVSHVRLCLCVNCHEYWMCILWVTNFWVECYVWYSYGYSHAYIKLLSCLWWFHTLKK